MNMGIEISARDRIFVAAILPLAILGGYWYGWRVDASKNLSLQEQRCDAMVSQEEYAEQKLHASRSLSAATRQLEEELAKAPVKLHVDPVFDKTPADREQALLGVLREVGLNVKSGQTPKADVVRALEVASVLERAASFGAGERAILRRYKLDGEYPSVKAALDMFVARRMAVVVEKIEMASGDAGRWMLEVWL